MENRIIDHKYRTESNLVIDVCRSSQSGAIAALQTSVIDNVNHKELICSEAGYCVNIYTKLKLMSS